MFNSSQLQVYFILGSNQHSEPLKVIEEALKHGITMFQLREKGEGAYVGEERKVFAKAVKQLCDRYQVPFVINDNVELAIEVGVSGVHLGQDDEPIEKARKRLPKDAFIGISATNIKEAVEAKRAGADYIGVGPIFRTDTKKDAKQPIGIAGLKKIKEAVGDLPIVAIGGIKEEHVEEIIEAGSSGVAVITALSEVENMSGTIARFKSAFK